MPKACIKKKLKFSRPSFYLFDCFFVSCLAGAFSPTFSSKVTENFELSYLKDCESLSEKNIQDLRFLRLQKGTVF